MGTGGCFAGSTAACGRCGADHSSPSHIHLKKVVAAIPVLPILLHDIHRDNFTVSNLKNWSFLSLSWILFDFGGFQCQTTSLPSILMILSLYHSVFLTHISLHSFRNIRFHSAHSPTYEISSCLDSGYTTEPEASSLLGCYTAKLGNSLSTFLDSYRGSQNVNHLRTYDAEHTRTVNAWTTPRWSLHLAWSS
jgi:hypothetical protein